VHGSNGKLAIDYEGRDQVTSGVKVFADAYRDEVIDFATSVRVGRRPRVGAQDGVSALRIAIAAGRWCQERRAVRLEDVKSD
jgi:predicted dehydrogenase